MANSTTSEHLTTTICNRLLAPTIIIKSCIHAYELTDICTMMLDGADSLYLESYQLIALYHLCRNSIVGALTPCMPFVRMSCRNAVYVYGWIVSLHTLQRLQYSVRIQWVCMFFSPSWLGFSKHSWNFCTRMLYIDVYPVTPLGETMVKGCWSTGQKHAIQLVGVYWSSALHLTHAA